MSGIREIGLMGGTFNPIHNGHLILAQAAWEQFSLDEIWFLPSRRPPHKDNTELPEDEIRLALLSRALESNPAFSVCLLEMQRLGEDATYTYDTMLELKKRYPKEHFSFIIGGDSLLELHKWYHSKDLFKGMAFLAAGRGGLGESAGTFAVTAQHLRETYGAQIDFIEMPQIDISSTALRQRAREKKTLRYYVPECVAEYIQENHIYSYKEI